MCGINGVFAWRSGAPPVDEGELLRVRERMRARGPDGAGAWISPDRRVGLAHRRLAILDVSEAGAQPMASADGRLVVTFNGEIYNFRELRRELESLGCVFRSGADTEVLLHLYARHGAGMVARLRGMFAFALWDAAQRTLLLARDPFGIKPLYLAAGDGVLRFASQVKALLAGGGVDQAPEPAGAAGFLLWGSVPEPYTLYRGIRVLPPGSTLEVRDGQEGAPRPYFSLRDEFVRAQDAARRFGPRDRPTLAGALADSVRAHLVADVPVGVFLSAGVDSTVIASMAAGGQDGRLRALTLGFEELRGTAGDETALAAQTAGRLALSHAIRWIGRPDFDEERSNLLEAMDQPTIDGINTYFVCREAARAGLKVALSGLGGDELLGGYPSFRQVPRLARALAWTRLLPLAGRLARRLSAPLLSLAGGPPKAAGLLEYGGSIEGAYLLRRALYLPWELEAVLDPVALRVGLDRLETLPALGRTVAGVRNDHARVAALESDWYLRNQLLRDADWAGMAHGVEVRVPFVDASLFRAVAPWLASERPPTKADAAGGHCPPELLERAKTGFTVPVRDWLIEGGEPHAKARGLRGWARHLLPAWPRQRRVLALVTDAWGSGGGIAQYNRDLLESMAGLTQVAELVVLPRHAPGEVPLPAGVRLVKGAARGKLHYVLAALAESRRGPWHAVIAAHPNLAALGWASATLARAPGIVTLFGIDAWTPHPSALVRGALRRMTTIVSISRVTWERFRAWAGTPEERLRLLPPAVDPRRFTPGPKPAALVARFGLEGRTVLLTVGRLSPQERYKGVDEVLDALPSLAAQRPEIAYVVCGDGGDRPRLEAKARDLGLADRVHFAGHVPEAEKAEYYRLADAYVMPSRGEGFGIVFLEAAAAGVPALGSRTDGGREALADGALGELVDPASPTEVREGILRALRRPRGVSPALAPFALPEFRRRAGALLCEVMQCEA